MKPSETRCILPPAHNNRIEFAPARPVAGPRLRAAAHAERWGSRCSGSKVENVARAFSCERAVFLRASRKGGGVIECVALLWPRGGCVPGSGFGKGVVLLCAAFRWSRAALGLARKVLRRSWSPVLVSAREERRLRSQCFSARPWLSFDRVCLFLGWCEQVQW